MKSEVIKLYDNREDVTLTTYVLDDSVEITRGKTRPAVLICPGGGYLNCSDREAEPVALKFATMGYHAFVLRYSVYQEGKGGIPDMTKPMEPKTHCVHPNPMREIGKAMLMIREHATEWLLDTERIAICGFSAGAHNCAMYAVNWNQPIMVDLFGVEQAALRPAAVILGYPLTDYCYMKATMGNDPIANGFFAISNTAFLGSPDVSDELLKEISPVYHVTPDTPPMFIWSTAADELVPIQHSIRMTHALADCKIPFELHIFENGGHGLSLADQTTAEAQSQINEDVQQWIALADKWLQKRFAYELPEMTEAEKMMQQFQQMRKEHVQVASDEFYQVTEIMPKVYRITSEEAVYMELFVGEEKALLLDTGYGYGNLKATIRRITDKPLIIVNSHGHLDHVCGNYQFDEDIYIHARDMELCKEHTSKEQRMNAIEVAKHTLDYFTNEQYNILPLDFDEDTYINAGTGSLVPVEEGKLFELGGITLEVIELPGHTSGCVGLYYREKKILYMGDSINGFLWLFMPEALTLSEYRKTLEKAQTIDFEQMVQAHNERVEPKSVLAYYMDADFAAVVISKEHLK